MKFQKIGRYLCERRKKSALTQGELADILGYSNPQFVSNWERGLSAPPPKAIRKIVEALDLDEDELLSLILSEQRRFWESHILKSRKTKKT